MTTTGGMTGYLLRDLNIFYILHFASAYTDYYCSGSFWKELSVSMALLAMALLGLAMAAPLEVLVMAILIPIRM